MIQFLVAAPCSGSGKTTLTCALLAAGMVKGVPVAKRPAKITAPNTST